MTLLKEKKFFNIFFPKAKVPNAINRGGGGVIGLEGTAIKKKYFFLRLLLPNKKQNRIFPL